MRFRVIFVMLLFAVGSAADALAQPPLTEKKRVVVLDFDFELVRPQVKAVFGTDVDVGRGMRDLLVMHLQEGDVYEVVPLAALDSVLDGSGLSGGDRSSAEDAARLGRMLGVDAVVMGTLTSFGGHKQEKAFSYAGADRSDDFGIALDFGKVHALVEAEARIVDVDAAEVMKVVEGRGEAQRGCPVLLPCSFLGVAGKLDLTRVDFTEKKFRDTPLGKAANQAGQGLATGLLAAYDAVPLRDRRPQAIVVVSEDERLVMNVGFRSGLNLGDQLLVRRISEEVRDPATAEVIHRLYEAVGMVEVTQLYEDSAEGRVVQGSGIGVGDLVGTESARPSGQALPVFATILASEIERRKAAGLDPDDTIDPSGADLRIGRTVYIFPMPYDLHLRLEDALLEYKEQLLVVTDDRKGADLWMRADVQFAASQWWYDPSGEAAAAAGRSSAAIQITPRGDTRVLWATKATNFVAHQDALARRVIKDLHKLLKGR